MNKIRFIKERKTSTVHIKVGEIVSVSKESAQAAVDAGYAEHVHHNTGAKTKIPFTKDKPKKEVELIGTKLSFYEYAFKKLNIPEENWEGTKLTPEQETTLRKEWEEKADKHSQNKSNALNKKIRESEEQETKRKIAALDISRVPVISFEHQGHLYRSEERNGIPAFVQSDLEGKEIAWGIPYVMRSAGEKYVPNVRKSKVKKTQEKIEELGEEPGQALVYLAQNEREKCTEEIVKHVKQKYTIHTLRRDKDAEMWIYLDGIYVPEARTYIEEEGRKILKDAATTTLINAGIKKIEYDTYITQQDFFDSEDKETTTIPVANGLLNVLTGEITDFTPERFFFTKIPIKYDPTKECPEIIKFIEEILPDESDVKTIQELIGYSLVRHHKFHVFVFFWGHGRNGKGVLLNLIKALVGVKSTTSQSLKDLETDKYSKAYLHNKLVNLAGDVEKTTIKDTTTLKGLTGEDPISADRKFKQQIDFTSYAKNWFSCNELPYITDNSDGFWDRPIFFTFPNRYLKPYDYNNKTDEEKKLLKISDPQLLQKLSTEEEMQGFLNWAIEGYKRLEKNSGFSKNSTTEEVKRMWTRKASTIEAYCMDFVKTNYKTFVLKKEFKRLYSQYCTKHEIRMVSDKLIKKVLEEQYSASSERSIDDGYIWEGIEIK